VDGPHVDLLRRFDAERQDLLASAVLRNTAYVRNGMACVTATGDYFGAHDEEGVLAVAREFLAIADGERPSSRPGRSAVGEPVRVRRIRHSDCFQVIDGQHRLALAVRAGIADVDVAVEPGATTTPLQDLVSSLSWTSGRRELYQPVDAPELANDWTLVRRCTDRLELMLDWLDGMGVGESGSTFLDIGACYGWFVAEMARRGFDARGVELDPNAIRLGEAAYGLESGQLTVGECSQFLRDMDKKFDVVSCFSVLHHFALGVGPCSAEDLIDLLDRVTGTVLFLDTGEAHEAWFRDLLPAWNTEHIAEWLHRSTTFREVVALGTDQDAVPPFEDNYGRTLFACLR
jgi:2-polyprenyl-3-methyl-5-hydroxy-6-metoxy-1,4-benzoquinol methylase